MSVLTRAPGATSNAPLYDEAVLTEEPPAPVPELAEGSRLRDRFSAVSDRAVGDNATTHRVERCPRRGGQLRIGDERQLIEQIDRLL